MLDTNVITHCPICEHLTFGPFCENCYFPQPIPFEPLTFQEFPKLCGMCGEENKGARTKCRSCHHTLRGTVTARGSRL